MTGVMQAAECRVLTAVMARVPGPVTVVTTVDRSAKRWGFTATSFSSVSLDPPLVLVCLDKRASTHGAFTAADHFMVNVLSAEQGHIARLFATSGTDRFAGGVTAPCELGLPGLAGTCARLACSMHTIVDGGDHSILIGRVLAGRTSDRVPLVYCDRSYSYPAPPLAGEPGYQHVRSWSHGHFG
jgi:flavin reductase ActVB